MFRAPVFFCYLPAADRSPRLPRFAVARRLVALAASCLAILFVSPVARAQAPGDLDTTFTSVLTGSTIFALTLQTSAGSTDLLAAGDAAGLEQEDLSGGYSDGFVIPDFGNAARIIYTAVPELVLNGTSDPKILLGGKFGRSLTQVQANTPGQNIVRVLANGTLDTSFNPGTGANDSVVTILPLADGSMVVGGLFTVFNGQNHNYIVRLDNTGATVDNSVFSSTLNFDNSVLTITSQINPNPNGPQGQILVAGTFAHVNGMPYSHLARINADGSVDSSFKPSFADRVITAVSQPDGKILVGGYFEGVNGVAVDHLVRLNYDGSVDASFAAKVTGQPPETTAPVVVNTITPASDGRYYIGGNFTAINGVDRRYLGLVLGDGTVDGFDPGKNITNVVQQVVIDPGQNRIYVGETRDKKIGTTFPRR